MAAPCRWDEAVEQAGGGRVSGVHPEADGVAVQPAGPRDAALEKPPVQLNTTLTDMAVRMGCSRAVAHDRSAL